jgi:hypothetical protein
LRVNLPPKLPIMIGQMRRIGLTVLVTIALGIALPVNR